jgi:diguanylate cyclase (GGDEF)-like protein
MNQPNHNKRNNMRHDEQGNVATSGIADFVVELPNQKHRRDVLQLLLGLSALFGFFFSYLNWEVNFPLSITELILAIYSLILLFLSRSFKQQFILSVLFLIPLYSLFLFAIAMPGSSETVYVWLLVVPVLSHLLLGRWYGLAMSAFFMAIGLALFIIRFQHNPSIFNLGAISNLALSGIAALVFSHVYEVNRARAHRQLLYLATTDSLTSLANRTRFLDVFERERNHAIRNETDLTLLLLDIDHFKRVNDTFGHDIGDEVLKHISTVISGRLRKTDLACRLGGEEFGVLLPGACLRKSLRIAEDIRKNIANNPYSGRGRCIHLSVSIGIAEYGTDGEDLETLYATADGYLYAAKAAGRNRIESRSSSVNDKLDSGTRAN